MGNQTKCCDEENTFILNLGWRFLIVARGLCTSKERVVGSGHHNNQWEVVFYWYIDSCRNGVSTSFGVRLLVVLHYTLRCLYGQYLLYIWFRNSSIFLGEDNLVVVMLSWARFDCERGDGQWGQRYWDNIMNISLTKLLLLFAAPLELFSDELYKNHYIR